MALWGTSENEATLAVAVCGWGSLHGLTNALWFRLTSWFIFP